MCAIQDQVILTKNYLKYIVKDRAVEDDKCRKCMSGSETIQHITAGCPTLAHTEYLHRHNCVAKIIHQELAHNLKLIDSATPYYQYSPEVVLENENHRLYWDRSIITDKTLPANRPDIVWIEKLKRKTWLINIAIPNTNNLQNTITNKLTKYADLAYEIKQEWRQDNGIIVPLVLSSTGIVPRMLPIHLKSLGLHPHIITTMQKSVILSTCNIVRNVLNLK